MAAKLHGSKRFRPREEPVGSDCGVGSRPRELATKRLVSRWWAFRGQIRVWGLGQVYGCGNEELKLPFKRLWKLLRQFLRERERSTASKLEDMECSCHIR